jgi:gluconate 5-dehydrogenase
MNNFNPFSLENKTALITGSSKGIGKALARALAQAGAQVVLNGRDFEVLSKTQEQFKQEGLKALISSFDVTDETAVTNAVNSIESKYGAIDILVNNSGIQIRNPLENYAAADWNKLMATNLSSVFYVSKAVVQHMIGRRAGKIINIVSVNAEHARAGIAPYSASKGAIKMLTKGMCVDWAKYGIQVNGLGPGYFHTEMTESLVNDPDFTAWVQKRVPTGRWGKVEELGGGVVFLASSASNFVNGHTLYVDGGITATL